MTIAEIEEKIDVLNDQKSRLSMRKDTCLEEIEGFAAENVPDDQEIAELRAEIVVIDDTILDIEDAIDRLREDREEWYSLRGGTYWEADR